MPLDAPFCLISKLTQNSQIKNWCLNFYACVSVSSLAPKYGGRQEAGNSIHYNQQCSRQFLLKSTKRTNDCVLDFFYGMPRNS